MTAGCSVSLLSGNHLCHNPRVVKEALALAGAGCHVVVLGAWLDGGLQVRDRALLETLPFRFQPVLDLVTEAGRTNPHWLAYRLRNRLGSLAFQVLGLANRWQFGYASGAMLSQARSSRSSLFIAHSEAGMLAAVDLIKRGVRVGVDLEDWFSEDLLPEARRSRPVGLLRRLEMTLLQRGVHATCPSRAMSQALADEFGCQPPVVVYNAFPWSDRKTLKAECLDRRDRRLPSVHWYSQTIGQGRGLEDLFAALPYLAQPVEVHLRGQPALGFDDWLERQIPSGWQERVFVHSIVSNEELLSRIAEHDIGFAGEMTYSRSRDLTVTNKILHYLLGGLAVVASDTRGQREVAELALAAVGVEPVLLYPSGDPLALAARINQLLASRERLAQAKAAALVAAERTFCWERQAPVLIESVRAALGEGPGWSSGENAGT